MLKSYKPKNIEEKWRKDNLMIDEKNEKNEKNEFFTIILPPPNITGKLHIGHALTVAIEDCLVRYYRMKGINTIYVPGMDHAGIATQVIVEKKLGEKENKRRKDYTRNEFVQKIQNWKDEYRQYIKDQLINLGGLFNWGMEYFTMDQERENAVISAFKILYDKGYIYRDNKLINWDCSLKSVISNIEIKKIKIESPKKIKIPNYQEAIEVGYIWYFKFDENITIATTRPETMLGDEAIVVHPDDKRYQDLIGVMVYHPIREKFIPIISDNIVDPNFGTGMLKITPGHELDDYECARRHNLPITNIFSDDGRIMEGFGKYSGMKRYDVRNKIIEEMEEKGLYLEKRANPMVISIGERTGDIIEPMIRQQWFMKTDDLSGQILKKIEKREEIEIYPKDEITEFRRWLENPQSWCISRQLWWGHRIPIYYQENNGELRQEEDVLDTWFSSALLPFSAFGWPEKNIDLVFPNSILETGRDIIYFWVIRMMMLSLAIFDKLPFKKILLHPMIRDRDGKKMSKSRGNVIDPTEIVNGISREEMIKNINNSLYLDEQEKKRSRENIKKEFPNGIPECGTDSLRFTLLSYLNQNMSINIDIKRFYENRTFCNKIWNAHKYMLIKIFGRYDIEIEKLDENTLDLKESGEFPINLYLTLKKMDKWILQKLDDLIGECSENIEKYNFGNYVKNIYRFVIEEFCDVYIEISKRYDDEITKHVLYYCLNNLYRLLHPTMPYLTEELYHLLPCQNLLKMKYGEEYRVYQQKYPKKQNIDYREIVDEFRITYKKIADIRNYRSRNKIKTKINLGINFDGKLLEKYKNEIIDLARLADVYYDSKSDI